MRRSTGHDGVSIGGRRAFAHRRVADGRAQPMAGRRVTIRMGRKTGSKREADALLKWALPCLLLAAAGAVGGMVLGGFTVGDGLYGSLPESASYADLSSNPDAVGADSLPLPACLDCADGYGVAGRAYASRADAAAEVYEPLEPVTIGYAPEPPADDGYRYGGTFAETAPVLSSAAPPVTAATREVADSKLIVLTPSAVPAAAPAPIPSPAATEKGPGTNPEPLASLR
jgi:hypothetical protein